MVVAVVVLAGCSPKRVVVANTPEGNACRRECMQLFNDCQDGKRKNRKACTARENDCLTTCPGAVLGHQSANPPRPAAALEVSIASPPAPIRRGSCVAEELPQWQGADAATKKQLMDSCREPAPQP